MISSSSPLRALSLGASLALLACTSSAPPREERLSDGFAQIQVHEAAIADARARADRPGPCDERCEAAQRACGEAASLCSIAHELEDADALTRCDQARAAACEEAPLGCGC